MKLPIQLIVLLITLNSLGQKNLIVNGGFESALNNWTGDAATLSPYDKNSGKYSCIIIQYTGSQWKAIDQTITIPKNTAAIEFSGWIKSDAIEKGKNDWNAGKFDIEFLNSSKKAIQNESVVTILGTTSWTFHKKIITVPTTASKFRVMLALGETNGTILFDDIKAIALSQEELTKIHEEENAKRNPALISDNLVSKPLVFTNGNFEEGMNSWRGYATISKDVFKEGEAALLIKSTAFEWTGIDQIADVPEAATEIIISGWLKSENIVQGKDIWNNGLLNVEFNSSDSKKTGDDQNVIYVTATSDWKYYSKSFPLPKGTKKYRIMLALGFASGTLYADAISVNFK